MVYSFLYLAMGIIFIGKIAQFECFYSEKLPTNPLKYMYEHTTGLMALRFSVDFILAKGVIFAIYHIGSRLIEEIDIRKARSHGIIKPRYVTLFDDMSNMVNGKSRAFERLFSSTFC